MASGVSKQFEEDKSVSLGKAFLNLKKNARERIHAKAKRSNPESNNHEATLRSC